MTDFTDRGGHRSAGSFRPNIMARRASRPIMTAHSTSYLQTPTKAQLREELEQAAKNTSELNAERMRT